MLKCLEEGMIFKKPKVLGSDRVQRFFPDLKINVKASIVLNKFMKRGHLGYLGVGYVSR